MRLILVALLASGLGACATRGSQFPVLAPTMTSDAAADCPALGSELERVAVLRREIAGEQNRTGANDVTSVAMSAITNPIAGVVDAAVTSVGASARNRRYDRAADAADQRISTLMTLRAERGCERPEPELALMSAFAAHAEETSGGREAREDAVVAFLQP